MAADGGKKARGMRGPAAPAGYCSRLAGDNLCRCGGNLHGRYCLWSHIPLPPPLAKALAEDGDGKRKWWQ